jgi:hypothetical protein
MQGPIKTVGTASVSKLLIRRGRESTESRPVLLMEGYCFTTWKYGRFYDGDFAVGKYVAYSNLVVLTVTALGGSTDGSR